MSASAPTSRPAIAPEINPSLRTLAELLLESAHQVDLENAVPVAGMPPAQITITPAAARYVARNVLNLLDAIEELVESLRGQPTNPRLATATLAVRPFIYKPRRTR